MTKIVAVFDAVVEKTIDIPDDIADILSDDTVDEVEKHKLFVDCAQKAANDYVANKGVHATTLTDIANGGVLTGEDAITEVIVRDTINYAEVRDPAPMPDISAMLAELMGDED